MSCHIKVKEDSLLYYLSLVGVRIFGCIPFLGLCENANRPIQYLSWGCCVDFCQSSVLECSSCVELCVKVNCHLSIKKGRLYGHRGVPPWASGLVHSQCVDCWLAVSPGVSMLACIYAGPHIGICLLTDVSWAAKPVSLVYFLLCVRVVASSSPLPRTCRLGCMWAVSFFEAWSVMW